MVGENPPVLVYLVAENHWPYALLVAAGTFQVGSSAPSRPPALRRLPEGAAKASNPPKASK
jgi:hypothetical protein